MADREGELEAVGRDGGLGDERRQDARFAIPGKRTLVEIEGAAVPTVGAATRAPAAAGDPATARAELAEHVAAARAALTALVAANLQGDPKRSLATACELQRALVAAGALADDHALDADPVLALERDARPHRAAAFSPSPASIAETLAGDAARTPALDREVAAWRAAIGNGGGGGGGKAPAKAAAVQRKPDPKTATPRGADVHASAQRGIEGATSPLPFAAQIQRAFGRHDVSSVQTKIGGDAQRSTDELAARAYTYGDRIAFAHQPDLHTAAHEAAHVIQQRAGVALPGDIDHVDDQYERHADAVADLVVAGKPAGALLDQLSGAPAVAAPVVQRDAAPEPRVDAAGYLQSQAATIMGEVRDALKGIKMVPAGPFGAHLRAAFETDLLAAITADIAAGHGDALLAGFKLFLAPEDPTAMVDRAREHAHEPNAADPDHPKEIPNAGPAKGTYASPVAIELANAIGRRYAAAINRLLPIVLDRWTRASVEFGRKKQQSTLASDPDFMAAGNPIKDIPATTPLERSLKGVFGTALSAIDFSGLSLEHAELRAKWELAKPPPYAPPVELGAAAAGPPRAVLLDFQAKHGKYHWVSATALDASQPITAVDVAAALFAGGSDQNPDGATQYASRLIALPPLFGFHADDVALFQPQHVATLHAQYEADFKAANTQPGGAPAEPKFPAWPADLLGPINALQMQVLVPTQPPDPLAELANPADPTFRLARAKANAMPGDTDGKDAASVVARLKDNVRVLNLIIDRLDKAGGDTIRAITVRDAQQHHMEEWELADLPDAGAEFALAQQQGTVLADIASAANEIALKYALYVDPDNAAQKKDPSIVELFDAAAAPLDDALGAIDFPEIATQRAAIGIDRARMLDVAMREAALHGGMTAIDAELHRDPAQKSPEFDAKGDAKQTAQLGYDLGAVRMQMAANPGGGKQELDAATEKISDLEFDISLGDKLSALNDLWKAIDDEEGFWEWQADELKGKALKAKSGAIRQKFVTQVMTPYTAAKKANDKPGQLAARDAFKKLLEEEFIPFANEIRDFVATAEKHKRWSKIIVGIMIAVVAFALGQFEFAALIDAGATWIEASVMAGAVTTTSSIVMEKLILNQDPTLGSIVMGFAGNVAVFGMIGKAAMAARAAGVAAEVGEATVGAAAKTAEAAEATGKAAVAGADAAKTSGAIKKGLAAFAKEVVFGEAFMLVSAEGTSLIDKGRTLTAEEALETAAMGVVNIIGMKVGQFAFDTTIDGFKELHADAKVSAKIAELGKLRTDLQKAGTALMNEAGGKGQLAKGKRAPRADAQALLEKWQDYFAKEHEVAESLLELAEKNPNAFKSKLAALEKVKANDAQTAELTKQFRAARALLGVEEIGPGVFRGDPKAMDAILAQHAASGNKIESVTTDPVTGQRTLKIVGKDGVPIEIIEKLADPAHRQPRAVPIAEARHFEAWLDGLPKDTPDHVRVRERMAEYYARDPKSAMALAEREYHYERGAAKGEPAMPGVDVAGPPSPAAEGAHALPPREAARAAYDRYMVEREAKTTSDKSDQWKMDRSDFEKWYDAGYEYDPVRERFVNRAGDEVKTDAATKAGEQPGQGGGKQPGGTEPLKPLDPRIDPNTPTRELGEVHSEAVGHELMHMLASGDANALRVVGIEPPPDFDPRATEWGLGRTKAGKIVLIRGGKGAVDWSLVPGVEDLAHSHPYIDPVTGKPRALKGENGSGTLDIRGLQDKTASPRTMMDLLYLMPSTSDLRFVALKGAGGGGHRVVTPYVSLGDGKIGNPVEGGNQPNVDITINHAEAAGMLAKGSEIVVYKATLELWAGDVSLGTVEIYQRYHASGSFRADWITLEAPDSMVPLEPGALGLKDVNPGATGASKTRANIPALGKLSSESMSGLVELGMPKPPKGSPLESVLKNLTEAQVQLIEDVAALHERAQGFDNWVKALGDEPTRMPKLLNELEAVRTRLRDRSAEAHFDAKGKAQFGDGDAAAAKQAKQLDKAKAGSETAKTNALLAFDGKGKAPADLAGWLDAVEAKLGAETTQAFFELLGSRTDLDLGTYRPLVDTVVAKSKIAPAQRRAILEASLDLDVDPAQFLEDSLWLADRASLPEARANLLDSAARGTLDLEWLRNETSITPAELDALGARSNVAWNKLKIAADLEAKRQASQSGKLGKADSIEAGKANEAVNPSIRGVAGELAATRIELPNGFHIEGRGTPQPDALEPDYLLKDAKGREAELEVKANTVDSMKDLLADAKRDPNNLPEGLARMVKQLKAARTHVGADGKPRMSYLALTDALAGTKTLKELTAFLTKKGAMPDQIVFMSEADILATGRAMREHLGIRQGNQE